MANRLIYQAKVEAPQVPLTGPTTPTTYGWYAPLTEPVIHAKVIYNQPCEVVPPLFIPVNPIKWGASIDIYHRNRYENIAY